MYVYVGTIYQAKHRSHFFITPIERLLRKIKCLHICRVVIVCNVHIIFEFFFYRYVVCHLCALCLDIKHLSFCFFFAFDLKFLINFSLMRAVSFERERIIPLIIKHIHCSLCMYACAHLREEKKCRAYEIQTQTSNVRLEL